MSTPSKVLVIGAFAALIVGWLLVRSSEVPVTPEPGRPRAMESDARGAPTPVPVVTVESNRDLPAADPPLPAEVEEKRLASLAGKMAAANGRVATTYLTSRGLSREDAERVAGEAARDMAACQIDAIRTQAAEQSVPFEELLDTIEALSSPDTLVLPPTLDSHALVERAAPCIADVQQRIGLPGPSGGLLPGTQ